MTAMSPNETSRTWQASQREAPVQVFLAEAQGDAPALGGARLAGFSFALNLLPLDAPLDPTIIAGAPAAVVQVHPDRPDSIERFRQARSAGIPLIAALYEPPLKVVRELILAGAHDVLPLPLESADLERSLGPLREALDKSPAKSPVSLGKTVVMLKAVGGVGATSLLAQTAIDYARRSGANGGEACLLDLDIQFGDAAFQLGMRPSLTLEDMISAGSRVDGAMLRAATAAHPSGLRVLAAPSQLLPLDALTNDGVIDLVTLAQREFGTVFIDLPSNWTNWSLSLVARADVVLLVTEMSVSCLHRARRQLDMLRDQEMGALDVRIIVNRVEKGLLRTVRLSDVEKSLGRDVAYTIANDHPLMRSAIDRGVPLSEIKSKSALGKDVEMLSASLASMLGQGG